MSTAAFMACVAGIAKRVSKDKLKKLEARHKEYHENLKAQGDPLADQNAAQRVVDEYNYELIGRKKLEAARVAFANRVNGEITSKQSAGAITKWAKTYEESLQGGEANFRSYTAGFKAIRALGHSRMAEMMNVIGPSALGFRGKAKLAGEANIIRELVTPGSTGDPGAAKWAQSWKQLTDEFHFMFNELGGRLPKLDEFWFPQIHSKVKLMRGGAKAMKNFVDWHMQSGRMNWDAMIDSNGKSLGRATPAERRAALESVWLTKTTDGANKPLKVGAQNSAVGNRMDEHRFLRYADAEQQYAAHQKYGDGNLYEVMMGYIDDMAHDMAMIQSFSPSPQWGHDYIVAAARKQAAQIQKASPGKDIVGDVDGRMKKFTTMYDMLARKHTAPSGGLSGVAAHGMAGLRQMQTGALLGSTSLIAIPGDLLANVPTIARMNKLPAIGVIKQFGKLMNPASSKDRVFARQSGVIAGILAETNFGASRLNVFDQYGPQMARQFSDFVMRTSLMAPATDMVRTAGALETYGMFARERGVSFADHPAVAMMQRYGITEADYNKFRALQPTNYNGAEFLRPIDAFDQIKDQGEALDLYMKFNGMILEETTKMSPDASIEASATLKWKTDPGTLSGELLRSVAMFKNFPITQYFLHGRNMLAQEGWKGKMSYLATFVLLSTGVGALAEQMKALSNGKDFYNMDATTPEGLRFWAQAFMTGGSLGFYGDVLLKDVNEYGRGTADIVAGPVAGLFDDVIRKFGVGNAFELIQGEDTNAASEAVRIAYKNLMPDTWWNHLVLKRLIHDQLVNMTDPKAASKIKKKETEMQKLYGQEMYWPEGQVAPQRAPAMSPR